MVNDSKQTGYAETHQPRSITPDQLADPDVYEALTEVSSIYQLKFDVLDILHGMGLTDFLFRWSTEAKDDLEGWGTLPKKLRKRFQEERCAKQDIATRYVLKTGSSVFVSDIEAEIYNRGIIDDSSAYTSQLIRLCYYQGYPDIYHMPVKVGGVSADIVCSFAAEGCDMPEFQRRIMKWEKELTQLAKAVVLSGRLRIAKEIRQDPLKNPKLTAAQLDLIRTMAQENLSLKEAAATLGITIDSANRRVAAAKKALGARTQAVAIYRATQKGLIK